MERRLNDNDIIFYSLSFTTSLKIVFRARSSGIDFSRNFLRKTELRFVLIDIANKA